MANHEKLAKFAKYFLIIVNIILVIIGLLAIALGLYVFFALDNVPPIFLVTIFVGGVLTAVICLLGCIGARKENPKLLRIYAGIITGLLILNLVLTAINATQGKLLVGSSMQSNIKKIFDDYGKDPFMTGSVDQIQQKLFCCGFYEPISMKQPGGIYPRSCCRLQESECRDPFPIGCSSLISNRASSAPTIAYWVGFAISWILYIFRLFITGVDLVTFLEPNPSHIFIIGGSTLVIVALHGYKGAVQKNPKLLKIYGWVMLILLASKFVVVVISMIQQNNPMAGLFKVSDVKKGFDVYGQDPIMTDSVDEIQHTLSCCGFYEPKSMIQSDGTYPRSCCSSQYESCRDPFPNGCSLKITNTLSPIIIGFWVEFALTVVAYILLASMAFYFASIIQRKTEAESTQPLHKYSQLEC